MAGKLVWKPGRPCNGQVYYMTVPGTQWQLAKYRRGDDWEYVLFEGNLRHPPAGFYKTAKEAIDVADELTQRRK